jgi:hypothetical protein
MDDDYQHIIRGPPIDRKPDRAALDAALEAEMQAPQPLCYHNPAIYIRAVAQATISGSLVKETFDNIIAYQTNNFPHDAPPQRMHFCDPASYTAAINDATVNGWLYKDFFDKFVAARVVFHQVVKIERPALAIRQSAEPRGSFLPRAQQAQEAQAHQPHGAQVFHDAHTRASPTPYTPQPYGNQTFQDPQPRSSQTPYIPEPFDDAVEHEPPSRPQGTQRHESFRPVDTQIDNRSPDPARARPRLRYAKPLPEQSATWDAVKRDRTRTAGRRRSRSPVAFEQASPSGRAGRQAGDLRSDQEEDPTLRDRYRDRDSAFHTGASCDHESNEVTHHTLALPAPEAVDHVLGASSTLSPRSVSGHRQHNISRALHLTRDLSRTHDGYTPEAGSHADRTSSYHPPSNEEHRSHLHDVPDQDHHTVQGNAHEAGAFTSTSTALQSSVLSRIERQQQKHQSAVCIECWSRALKCDSRAHCRECAKANRPCTYVQCPLKDCASSIICPAYHLWTGDDSARSVGSSMHLMELLRMAPPSSLDYNLIPIQNMYSKSDSAAGIYRRIKSELEEAARNNQEIDREFVKQLVLNQGMTCRALVHKADLITKFVAEKK